MPLCSVSSSILSVRKVDKRVREHRLLHGTKKTLNLNPQFQNDRWSIGTENNLLQHSPYVPSSGVRSDECEGYGKSVPGEIR